MVSLAECYAPLEISWAGRHRLDTAARIRATVPGVESVELNGAGDDRLNPPSVTPEPAPPDDRLVKLAALGSALGAIAALTVLLWLRRNVRVSVSRRP